MPPIVLLTFERMVGQFAAAENAQAVLDAVHEMTAPDGLNAYAAWRVPVFRFEVSDYRIGRNLFVHKSVPADFWPGFFKLAELHGGSSPSSQYALLQRKPMTLTEAMRMLALTERQRWLYNHLRKHKMRDLFYCPIGRWILVFWSDKTLKLKWQTRALTFHMAFYALARMDEVTKKFDGSAPPPPTERELQVLLLASRGQRAASIANTLGIKVTTVRDHLAQTKKKLGAKSVMHAACQAIRLQLMD